ncbi:hypothetical protein MWU38_10640 [Qipengyuania sp. S6317L1]|uniref:hypothetical protein n=1 Tax=Qipengyuania sp. S6317L1 TaxID=2926410 RepID=UPI001FF19119|nr:hypothetical protein [Qipengyuania sp. S6317L1]MCK0099840.1 hypothetical protein [Qipengyuania sp. S6317L1]
MSAKSKKSKAGSARDKARLDVEGQPEKSKERNLADVSLDPAASGMAAARMFIAGSFGEQDSTELYLSLSDKGKAAASGDLTHYKTMLAAQADTLNSVFTELARRAALNMGEYISATEIYMRLALKAQVQCKANIEALDRLSNGRVQTVRHVHVNDGGQAVIADEFHHHTGGRKNGKSNEQPHATGTAGKSPAMLSQDAQGDGVPVSSGKGKQAVPDARR